MNSVFPQDQIYPPETTFRPLSWSKGATQLKQNKVTDLVQGDRIDEWFKLEVWKTVGWDILGSPELWNFDKR